MAVAGTDAVVDVAAAAGAGGEESSVVDEAAGGEESSVVDEAAGAAGSVVAVTVVVVPVVDSAGSDGVSTDSDAGTVTASGAGAASCATDCGASSVGTAIETSAASREVDTAAPRLGVITCLISAEWSTARSVSLMVTSNGVSSSSIVSGECATTIARLLPASHSDQPQGWCQQASMQSASSKPKQSASSHARHAAHASPGIRHLLSHLRPQRRTCTLRTCLERPTHAAHEVSARGSRGTTKRKTTPTHPPQTRRRKSRRCPRSIACASPATTPSCRRRRSCRRWPPFDRTL